MSIWKERLQVFFQYKDLLFQLVQRDVKLKYRRSFLGYVWSVLNPLLIMLVMTVVFSTMFQRKITNYPVYLITGRTLFEFYSTSTKAAMRSILGNGTLLKKTYVPKYIFPLAKVTSSLVDCFFSLGAMLIVIALPAAFSHYSGADLYFQPGSRLFPVSDQRVLPGYAAHLSGCDHRLDVRNPAVL